MSHTPHEIHDEFPQLADRINELKQCDGHFARLASEYHALNRAVHRAAVKLAKPACVPCIVRLKRRLRDPVLCPAHRSLA